MQLLHVFRNTPPGRNEFRQSLHFCAVTGTAVSVYLPRHPRFLLYFENDVVQIDLDPSYFTDPETARAHVADLAGACGISPRFLDPRHFTTASLPDLSTRFDWFACPGGICDLTAKIGPGHVGHRLRGLLRAATFPVLLPGTDVREWDRITVFFGGSVNAVPALKLGFRLAKISGLPLEVFTHAKKGERAVLEKVVARNGLSEIMERSVSAWRVMETGRFAESLYQVSPNALVVMGAYGHGLIRDLLLGSKLEIVRATLSNPLLVVGPRHVPSPF